MENTTVGAWITASGAVVAAVIGFAKGWGKKPADTSPSSGQIAVTTGDISSSMVVGENITQTGIINHHYAPTIEAIRPLDGRVASSLTISGLWDDLESTKNDYLREQARHDYAGHPVSWPVEFYSLARINDDNWVVNFVERGRQIFMHPLILVDANFEKYPQLKKIKKGDVAWVVGKIKDVSPLSIHLEDEAEITFKQ
ncbi:MAG TPA: hypothetical protein VGU46_05765 [Acidobacteriaceae bacterium]|nr:hypothetical protein [Acidobacteriaceae bacterium]